MPCHGSTTSLQRRLSPPSRGVVTQRTGLLMQRALSPSSMAMRTKPPHEAGFTTLAVLVTLSLVSALLFGLWQQLDLNRDALLSERSYLHRRHAAQSLYQAAVQRLQSDANLALTSDTLATLRGQLANNQPQMTQQAPCLPTLAMGLCLANTPTSVADNWPNTWWESPGHLAMTVSAAAQLPTEQSHQLPQDHPLKSSRYWLVPFAQANDSQLAWQIIMYVPASAVHASDTMWMHWWRQGPP